MHGGYYKYIFSISHATVSTSRGDSHSLCARVFFLLRTFARRSSYILGSENPINLKTDCGRPGGNAGDRRDATRCSPRTIANASTALLLLLYSIFLTLFCFLIHHVSQYIIHTVHTHYNMQLQERLYKLDKITIGKTEHENLVTFPEMVRINLHWTENTTITNENLESKFAKTLLSILALLKYLHSNQDNYNTNSMCNSQQSLILRNEFKLVILQSAPSTATINELCRSSVCTLLFR